MCGIIGYVSEHKDRCVSDRAAFLRQALMTGVVRGEHSTGVFYSPGDPKERAAYGKSKTDGMAFVWSQQFDTLMDSIKQTPYVVGHNRAATVGTITVDNAHPFQEKQVTMVHNGTLPAFPTRPKGSFPKRVTVDSNAIAMCLGDLAPADAPKFLEELRGSFALIWHDARDGSLNFVRNATRPLHFGWSTTIQGWVFTSEPAHLRWLAGRIKMGVTDLYSLEAGKMMKFPVGQKPEPEIIDINLQPKSHQGSYGRSWAALGERPAPKPQALPAPNGAGGENSENSVDANAERAKRSLEARLLDLGLTRDDLIAGCFFEYEPVARKGGGPGRTEAHGWSPTLGYDLICFDMPENAIHAAEHDRGVVVKPIGIKKSEPEEAPIIVVKVEYTTSDKMEAHEDYAALELFHAREQKAVETRTVPDKLHVPVAGDCGRGRVVKRNALAAGMHYDAVLLPSGTELTPPGWYRYTNGGCVVCADPILLADQEHTYWTEGDDPVCRACVETEHLWQMKQGEQVAEEAGK